MQCHDIEQLLTSWLLGDLPRTEAAKVKQHVEHCDGCRAAIRNIEPTLDLLRAALADPSAAPERLSPAHRQRIENYGIQSETTRTRPRVIQWITVSHPQYAYAAALLLVGFFVVSALLMPAVSTSKGRASSIPQMVGKRELLKGRTETLEDYLIAGAVSDGAPDQSYDVQIEQIAELGEPPTPRHETVSLFSRAPTDEEIRRQPDVVTFSYADTDDDGLADEPNGRIALTTVNGSGLVNAQNVTGADGVERWYSDAGDAVQWESEGAGDKVDLYYSIGEGEKPEKTKRYGYPVKPPSSAWRRALHGVAEALGGDDDEGARPPGPSSRADYAPQPEEIDAITVVKSPVVLQGLYGSRSPGMAENQLGMKGDVAASVIAPPEPKPPKLLSENESTAVERLVTAETVKRKSYASRLSERRTAADADSDADGLGNTYEDHEEVTDKKDQNGRRERLSGGESAGGKGAREWAFGDEDGYDLSGHDRQSVSRLRLETKDDEVAAPVDIPSPPPPKPRAEPGGPNNAPAPLRDDVDVLLRAEKINRKAYTTHLSDTLTAGDKALQEGKYDDAKKIYEESLRLVKAIGDRPEDREQKQQAEEGLRRAEKQGEGQNALTVNGNVPLLGDVATIGWLFGPDVQEESTKQEEEQQTGPRFKAYGVNPFFTTADQSFSTFSIDVDTAAYTLARNYMRRGYLPPAESVRTEEFVNFFDYQYPAPDAGTFKIYATAAPSPFGRGLQMLKIGVKGRRLGREEQRPAVLTFLIDTSGSMNQPDRLGLVKKSLHLLVGQLAPQDRVAIVQYDSRARLVLEHTPASQKEAIEAAIDSLQCGGSTNLEEGMRRAYELAARSFLSGAENRVLLLSDGVANLGTLAAEDILDGVASFRKQGITCSVFGFGIGTYDDTMLEALANKGDGAYVFIDSEDEAQRVMVDDLAATLNTIAADVKIQVEFNPQRVTRYRQLGYENRQLKKEDFRNDAVDAGEVGSGQSVTALYELELKGPDRAQPLGVVRLRFRREDTGVVEEIERAITERDLAQSFEAADARFRLATCAAEFAEILRGTPFATGSEFEDVATRLRPVLLDLPLDHDVRDLLHLIQSAPGMSRGEL